MPKTIKMPKPIGKDGKELSQEEIASFSDEPEYVPVDLVRNDFPGTFHVACDFEVIDRSAERAYQRFKQKQLRSFATMGDKDETKEGLDKINEAAALEDELISVFVQMAFPDDKRPFILASDVPEMPPFDNSEELQKWFEGGSPVARNVISSVIGKYDPTSPLAFLKRVLTQSLDKAATEANRKNTEEEAEKKEAEREREDSGSGNPLAEQHAVSETASQVTEETGQELKLVS
jgi:hypothetical protein